MKCNDKNRGGLVRPASDFEGVIFREIMRSVNFNRDHEPWQTFWRVSIIWVRWRSHVGPKKFFPDFHSITIL